MSGGTLLYAAGVFLFAGTVKGVIGMGFPAISVALLAAVVSPLEAASLMLMPAVATNLWQVFAPGDPRPVLARLWPMLLGVAAAAPFGTALLAGGAHRATTLLLGAALALYAVTGLARLQLHLPRRAERWAAPAVGVGTGLIAGATGVFSLPSVPYLAALGLPREDLVQALGLTFSTASLALAAGLAWHGALPLQALGLSAAGLVPALLGNRVGDRLRTRARPETFRVCFFAGLLALGLIDVARAVA